MRSYDNLSQRLLVISAVKDEAATLDRTIRSVAAQAQRPSQWLIVVDGVDGDTLDVAEAAARAHPWIKVVRRPAGAGKHRGVPALAAAFREGLRRVDIPVYDYLCKLDGGLELPPAYFATLLRRFAADPRLGIAEGAVAGAGDDAGRPGQDLDQEGARLYRCICFQEIGGFDLDCAVLWDGIDLERSRKLGWKAVRDTDPALEVRRLRPSRFNLLDACRSSFRWGRDQFVMRTSPPSLARTAIRRSAGRPRILGGLCILAGYLAARLHPRPTDDDRAFRRALHRWRLVALSPQLLGTPRPAGTRRPATVPVPARPNFQVGLGRRVAARSLAARNLQAGR